MQQPNQYFEQQEDVNKLWFTSDNLAFFEEQNAINHAKRLKDKTIIPKTRAEVESELAEITKDGWDEEGEYDPLDEPDAE
jgi:hypothetical protein